MKDLDSAVGRLDNILMSVYFVVVVLIIAVALVRGHSFEAGNTANNATLGSASGHTRD